MPFSRKRLFLAVVLGAILPLSGVVALADGPKEGFSPDPPAKASAKHWVFEVAVRSGKLSLTKVRAIAYARPVETPRVHGRFAIELAIGKELLDRIRFDVPLMGTGPTQKNPRHPFPRPGFDNVTTNVEVRIADNPRATYVLLVDRASGTLQRFQWPPEADGRLVPWTVPVFHGEDAGPLRSRTRVGRMRPPATPGRAAEAPVR